MSLMNFEEDDRFDRCYKNKNKGYFQITKTQSLEAFQHHQQQICVEHITRIENNVEFPHYQKQNIWNETLINTRKLVDTRSVMSSNTIY